MTQLCCNLVFVLLLRCISASFNFNLQDIEGLIPPRSTLQLISDFGLDNEIPWKAKLSIHLLQNQNFLKVLRNVPKEHVITTNKYYASCDKNESLNTKYLGHSVTRISLIFLHQVTTEFEKCSLIQTRERQSHCGENPAYIFIILSHINIETFRISSDSALTSKLLSIK